ncbi:hypothetical protein B5F39_07495 [Cloacibacillus sp. An23]|nr:hypothetical protein B5F39_07495 [Cloacibacillus sp. An23]
MTELRPSQIGLQRAGAQVKAGTEGRRSGLAPERSSLRRRAAFKELRVAASEALMSGRGNVAIRVVPRSVNFSPLRHVYASGAFFIAVRGGISEDEKGEV